MRHLVLLLFATSTPLAATAAVYHESDDAASALPGLAQEVGLVGAVDAIEGQLAHAFDADVYRIRIYDPLAFSAQVNVIPRMAPDPQLFLFDEWGRGIVANDNVLGSPLAQIPRHSLRGQPPGTYLLGVAPTGIHPLLPSGERVFPPSASGWSQPSGLSRFVPYFDWSRDILSIGGSYAIGLTGVTGVPQATRLPGDYNGDGVVGAADYIAWRNGLGTEHAQADYDVWRAHFGQTTGSGAAGYSWGASASSKSAVPEPGTLLLAALGMSAMALRRSASGRHTPIHDALP